MPEQPPQADAHAAWRAAARWAACLLALILSLAPAPPAFAHASLVRSEPADGAVVAIGGTRTINLAANDSDSDGTLDLASIQIVQAPQHGTITVNADGTVTAFVDNFSVDCK